jgi:hypothetical protein
MDKNTNDGLLGYGYTSDDEFLANQKKATLFSMKIVAKLINKKGFGTIKLYAFLRALGYIDEGNSAIDKYVQEGYFVNQATYRDFGGIHGDTNQVLATIKGLELIKKLVKEQTK